MSDPVVTLHSPSELTLPVAAAAARGRPRSPHAQSPAQRSKAYRDRLTADGRKPVKCYLAPEQMAYLDALCEIHQITIAEAIGLALTALIRGAPPAP